jgi:hypothetical protein
MVHVAARPAGSALTTRRPLPRTCACSPAWSRSRLARSLGPQDLAARPQLSFSFFADAFFMMMLSIGMFRRRRLRSAPAVRAAAVTP